MYIQPTDSEHCKCPYSCSEPLFCRDTQPSSAPPATQPYASTHHGSSFPSLIALFYQHLFLNIILYISIQQITLNLQTFKFVKYKCFSLILVKKKSKEILCEKSNRTLKFSIVQRFDTLCFLNEPNKTKTKTDIKLVFFSQFESENYY